MKGKLFSCLVLMFLSISMVAQKVPVSGTVSDQTGPVIGASVIEKGTTNGTMTDNDGHFTLTVSKGAVIEISSIGYKTQEITVGAQTNFTVTLSEDNEFLDEVVVVGYGSMKKSDLAGASVSMKESDLKGSIIRLLTRAFREEQQVSRLSPPPELLVLHLLSASAVRRLSMPMRNLSTSLTVSSFRAAETPARISVSEMLSETEKFPRFLRFPPSTLPISSAWKSSRMPLLQRFTVRRERRRSPHHHQARQVR